MISLSMNNILVLSEEGNWNIVIEFCFALWPLVAVGEIFLRLYIFRIIVNAEFHHLVNNTWNFIWPFVDFALRLNGCRMNIKQILCLKRHSCLLLYFNLHTAIHRVFWLHSFYVSSFLVIWNLLQKLYYNKIFM